ncbi:hypothetical protein BS47DRAFT_1156251 [Hydnum rufescens UP504]|uniref:Uncharacterized protein n=1 Tax=Hydnum rufescens UP504 TaxID=1448309 RepID=A0A9P6E1M9_9AGAM|nr:hypothetical protein BS47DRAFT_1156251 [Hydnum rufescens UP504]
MSIPIMMHSPNHFSEHTVLPIFCLSKDMNLRRHFVIYGSFSIDSLAITSILFARPHPSTYSHSKLKSSILHPESHSNHTAKSPYSTSRTFTRIPFFPSSLILWLHLLPFLTSFLADLGVLLLHRILGIVFDISNSAGSN